jgi:hypothetical protein
MRTVTVGAQVGRSGLVDRQALADFLTHIAESANPEAALQVQKKVFNTAKRRTLRGLIQNDSTVATLATMPMNIIPSAGKLEIEFTCMEELAGALHAIAQILENEFEEFADRFEPEFEAATEIDPVVEDLRRAFAELRSREREKSTQRETK